MRNDLQIGRFVAGLIGIAGFLCAINSALAQGCGFNQLIITYDMEDGFIPGSENGGWSAFLVQEPAKILSDLDGNRFLRLTATPRDGGHGGHAERVRSQTSVGGGPAAEGDIGTYRFSLRLGDNAPKSTVLWQLFQYSTVRGQGYAVPGDGEGPTMWIWGGADGSIGLRNYYDDERKLKDIDLGRIARNRFVKIEVSVYWSLNPSLGRIDVWVDGRHAGSMSETPTMLSPLSHPGVDMHIGTYGDHGVGVVDFDNITISNGMASTSECSAPNAPRATQKTSGTTGAQASETTGVQESRATVLQASGTTAAPASRTTGVKPLRTTGVQASGTIAAQASATSGLQASRATALQASGTTGAQAPGTAGVHEIGQAQTTTAAQAASSTPIVISQSGSYRLVSNVVAGSTDAIQITADNVILDLNGFSVLGSGRSGTGISASGVANVMVFNGVVRGMGEHGLDLGRNSLVYNVQAIENTGDGIRVGLSSIVRDSIAESNGSSGIVAFEGSKFHGNVVTNPSVSINTASSAGGPEAGIESAGLISSNHVAINGGDGIRAGSGSAVLGNNVTSNGGVGLKSEPSTGFSNNVFAGNQGGNVASATEFGPNFCSGDTTCGQISGQSTPQRIR